MSDHYAPSAILEARDRFEKVDAHLASLKDELRGAERDRAAAVDRDRDEGAAALLSGKRSPKDPRRFEKAADERIAALAAEVESAERAHAVARMDLYRTVIAGRAEWFANLEEPRREARDKVAEGIALAREGMQAMSTVAGVEGFLRDYGDEGARSRPEVLARRRLAMGGGRYWPTTGVVSFANPVRLSANVTPSPLDLLELLARVLEEPKAPAVAELRSDRERSFANAS